MVRRCAQPCEVHGRTRRLWDGEGTQSRPSVVSGSEMALTPERVLVTGGGGFIGSALVRSLVAAGHEVHLVRRSAERAARLGDVQDRCVTHVADLTDAAAVREAVRAGRPDVVYHLAA